MFHITMFWIWDSVGSVLGVPKKTLHALKMFNISNQDIEDLKRWSCFNVMLTNIGPFESSKFLHVTFFKDIVFIFWRCLLWKL